MKIKKWCIVKCCNEVIQYSEFINKQKTHMSIRLALKKHLKKHNSNILKYYNEYYDRLEMCNFCKTEFAKYSYTLSIDDKNEICFNNMTWVENEYMCDSKHCKQSRAHLNGNSDIKISTKFKISLDEAKKYRIANNKSCFYFHPGVDDEEKYKSGQSRSLSWYIEKYGEEEGRRRSKKHYDKISHANKRTTLIEKYGIERANKISNGKKQTLENFINRYGEEEGKLRYTKWITTCTTSGKYINLGYTLSSKVSYDFFIKLTDMLINNNLAKRDDIIFADGHNKEYQIRYFNEQNKLRWFYLDFVILSKKINIEFNGSAYHANPNLSLEAQQNWNAMYSKKTFNERTIEENRRDEIVKSHGYSIFKIWDSDINTVERYEHTIKDVFNKIKDMINNENVV